MKTVVTIQVIVLLTASFIPEGRFVAGRYSTCQGDCGCSAESQKNGTCCCTQKEKAADRSCCRNTAAECRTAPDCCGKKSASCCDSRTRSPGAVVRRCPCDAEYIDAFIVHAPRTVVKSIQISELPELISFRPLISESAYPDRDPPATPPPETVA